MNNGELKTLEQRFNEKIDFVNNKNNTLLGIDENVESLQAAEQFRRAVQMFASNLTPEQALEIATVYPKYEVGKTYKVDMILSYGTNSVGDPQLYRVIQEHTSQADWTPDVSPSLFSAIGLDDSGYPIWSQPTGAHDAYITGDIVNYNDTLYKSLIDGNTYSPEAYSAGWEVVENGS